LRITFLGTGTSQGVPVIACKCPACQSDNEKDRRLRSSILVECGEEVLVIDTGPDFRQQMLQAKVKQLNAVLYTHEHRDHIAGLDDIRAFNFIQQRPMDMYAEQRVIRALNGMFPYVFAEKKYPGVPQVNLHEISTEPFYLGEQEIIPIRMMHYRLPVLGFRIGEFAYLTDGNYISESEKEKLIGVKTLVVNALRHQTHLSHFTLDEAINLINEISPRQGLLTHISHQMGPLKQWEKDIPPHIRSAYDGLALDL